MFNANIQEQAALTCEMIDETAHEIRGVKLLGFNSRNKRRYLSTALEAAIPLYEGAKVNVNHPKGKPTAPRDYQDRLGVIKNVEFREDQGLFGTLQFNPKHACSPQLIWEAQFMPNSVGMSHNVFARGRTENQEQIIEAIERVISVDLVADPATTDGLFEHEEFAESTTNAEPVESITRETLEAAHPEIVHEIYETIRADAIIAVKQLHAAKLPATAIDESLIEQLIRGNEPVRTRLLTERTALVEAIRNPLPRTTTTITAAAKPADPITKDVKEFANALRL